MRAAHLRIEAGVQLGPYRIEHRLAEARASTLYLAHASDGCPVILRVVEAEAATRSARARMKREARALAGIDHPSVVRVHGTGEHAGMPWIAWNQVRGTELERVLAERGSLPFDIALRYAIQMTEALVAAHSAGVVHREVKPSNVILSPDGCIVLVDFGIAPRSIDPRDVDGASGLRAAPDELSAYAAPEQIEHGLSDERSDVWAVGCLLFEMLVGEPPFGRGGNATTEAIPRDEPVFPSTVPITTVHIISACLRKNSFARIATARELLVLLKDALKDPRIAPAPPLDRSGEWTSGFQAFFPSGTIPPPPRLPSMALAAPTSRFSSDTSRRPPPSTTRAKVARGRIKGTALRAGLTWFTETYGPTAIARVMELASPELKGMLRTKAGNFGLVASSWYDTQRVGELIDLLECVAATGDRPPSGSSIGEAIGHDHVGGTHSALFRLVSSPVSLEANAQRIWRTYVDEGTLSVRIRAEGSFDARVRGWSHHHPSVCRTLGAMLESSLRTAGYTALVLERTHCISRGDTQCVFDGTWKSEKRDAG